MGRKQHVALIGGKWHDRPISLTLPPSIPSQPPAAMRVAQVLLLLLAAVFFGLHFVHLTADFPNHSPWMDWAKYTDEGWYGDAAIRHYQRGSWYVAGDFNPAVALPVWPLLEAAVFGITGVSLAAARALTVGVFGLTLLSGYLLLQRWRSSPRSLAPSVAVLLLAVSPFCYVFMRMAVLEPLLILLTLLALLAASGSRQDTSRSRRMAATLALGVLLPLMILTKTTAIFLFPSIAWILYAAERYRWRNFLRTALPAGVIAACIWSSYFFLFVRPHFLVDYKYLFSANGYTGITLATVWPVITDTVRDGMWIGPVLYPAAVTVVLTLVLLLRKKTPPLPVALLLWIAGYTAFLAYHNNLQPRYYLVVAVPLVLLLPVILEDLLALWPRSAFPWLWIGRVGVILLIAAIAVPDAFQMLHFVRSPEYTFVRAAERIRKIVASTPDQNQLILSISGSDISLITGLPSICDDFGTLELAERATLYRPGWYAAWNQVDDDKMDALGPLFHLERVAAFPAMDDPERNLLILYRLDPARSEPEPQRKRKAIPRRLQTKVGQQPSVLQLEH